MDRLDTRPHCPTCNTLSDGYTAMVKGSHPSPGDVSICSTCNEVLQFTDDMDFKLASVEVIEECGLLEISQTQRKAREHKSMMNFAKNIGIKPDT